MKGRPSQTMDSCTRTKPAGQGLDAYDINYC